MDGTATVHPGSGHDRSWVAQFQSKKIKTIQTKRRLGVRRKGRSYSPDLSRSYQRCTFRNYVKGHFCHTITKTSSSFGTMPPGYNRFQFSVGGPPSSTSSPCVYNARECHMRAIVDRALLAIDAAILQAHIDEISCTSPAMSV